MKFAVWDNEDSLIMTWLWNSMTPEVGRHCMFLSSAQEIWDTVRSTYSLKQDMAARYELRNKIFSMKQDSSLVTAYYGTLKELRIELDQFQSLKMQCTADATTLAKEVENERIFDFLAGLNPEYDPIRVQILGKETFPSLSAVFNTVRGEESRRGVMMNSDKSTMLSSHDGAASKPTDGSVMISTKKNVSSQGNSFTKFSDGASSRPKKDDRWCSYCRRTGHIKDLCFRLHGKQKVLEKMARMSGQTQPVFRQDELERLWTIFDSLSKPSGTSDLAMTGSRHEEDDPGC
ncbi:uncharacterized protein LOC133295656 [Gastrolobium bilobum]|uniref:uncharacterized protein LOC133295656 n=1 Tax=Gastrolobium bilobum TaxID=150636 RepID=UPI002AB0FCED|nr:uncharacterized protein LOC133295656 [Gastrolobium bilobum]